MLVDNITLKVDSADTHGRFIVVETNNEPGAGVPPITTPAKMSCFTSSKAKPSSW